MYTNHRQTWTATDRYGNEVAFVEREGWEDDTMPPEMVDDGLFWQESDGEGEFDRVTDEDTHSALLRVRTTLVFFNGREVGEIVHRIECQMEVD